MDWKKIKPELQKKLDPKNIKPAPRGKFGDYVDAHHVISEANRIFGEDGWSYEITRLQLVSEQTVETQKGPQFRVGYMATVRVHVDSVAREGAAVGSGVGNPDNIADHHESAIKEAETDAMKRALRSFGNTFGLALYDKTRENVGIDEPPFDAVAAKDRISKEMDGCETYQQLSELWTRENATVIQIGKAERSLGVQLYEKRNQLKTSLPDTTKMPPPNGHAGGQTFDDEIPF